MERIDNSSDRRDRSAENTNGQIASLDLAALRRTPGFMIRILQLQIFERFYLFFEKLEMSPAEYAILLLVRDNTSITQSELAAVLKMQLPNLIKILSLMENQNTIRRRRSVKDKRAVELSLSAAGRKRAEEASRLGEQFNAETLRVLGKQERANFLEMLGRLAAPQIGFSVK
jgi:DNA-binding MarR family transcriptional regulator